MGINKPATRVLHVCGMNITVHTKTLPMAETEWVPQH